MSRRNNFVDKKVTGFRMWKSGKKWLFGASVLTAMSFAIGTQTVSAYETTPVQTIRIIEASGLTESNILESEKAVDVVEDGKTLVSDLATPVSVSVSGESGGVVSEEPQLVTEEVVEDSAPVAVALKVESVEQPQTRSAEVVPAAEPVVVTDDSVTEMAPAPVRIHYKANEGDQNKYYAWVWGDTETHKNDGRWLELTGEGRDKTLTIQGDKGVTEVKYIIVRNQDWKQRVTGTEDLVAPVNKLTATDIYHGADGWYSQFHNVQTKDFDKKYGYTDKIVNDQGQVEIVGKNGQLGATFHQDDSVTFNVWAPTANQVQVNLYQNDQEDAPFLKSFALKKGTDSNPDDHRQNTIGLWTLRVSSKDLNGTSLKNLSYDYTLKIPKAYFIQKTEDWQEKVKGKGEWHKVGEKYVNSASATKKQPEQVSSKSSIAEIAKLYVGPDEIVTTQDPYSVATVKNGKRSVIIDPKDMGKQVTKTKNVRVKSKTEMSVLEVDVRDFSIDPDSGISKDKRGNFLGMVEPNTKNPHTGHKTGLDYLKYLGVKYLQVMPIYDFQTVPELDKDDEKNNEISKEFSATDQQNWGYDPKNYNVPEGSYSSDPANPLNRIVELKEMVQQLHNEGINVVMDVVYNHLYDGQNNPFEYTVPGYFYAINKDGAMNNDVGVGNAVRSNSEMMRQYIVNSVIYWTKEYGMDGFRFDAMSDLDVVTLNLIREALDKVDPNIVTYGEGWDSMGKYLDGSDGEYPASIKHAKLAPKYGFFDSTSRDSIAGSAYDHGPERPGFVNRVDSTKGKSDHISNATQVSKSLLGGLERSYQDASQQLNYIEVHDGMTLSDLMWSYNPQDTIEQHRDRVELATAMSALAQGIHFSQHGQEFLRTKKDGNHYLHNTYNAGDEKNKIDWKLVKDNIDVVNFTKSLMSLRQSEGLWHLTDYETIINKMKITNAQNDSGIITFELTEDNGDKYLVVFNNNTLSDKDGKLTLGGNHYYYNNKNERGKINEGNDFSNAFIVTTNSKNLYGKIGQMNREKEITFDHLTASVLYIPAPDTVSQVTNKQIIHYVDKQGKNVEKDNVQEVTYLKIEHNEPKTKFTYAKSGIDTTSDKELGNAENVLVSTKDDITRTTKYYYAWDRVKKEVVVNPITPQIIGGIPLSNDTIEWIEAPLMTKEVPHPKVEKAKVVKTTAKNGNLEKVTSTELPKENGETTITVTYAKQSRAMIVSETDPENDLQDASKKPSEGYFVDGYDGEKISFNKDYIRLEREGYTYTVNGKSTLDDAIKETPKFGEKDTIFKVIYIPNDAKARVEFIDADNKDTVVETKVITGKTDGAFEIVVDFPDKDKYEIVKWEPTKQGSYYFDKADDTDAISQVIKVTLKHKHEKSQEKTSYTVTYKGADVTENIQNITWDVDKDLVTGKTIYTPQGNLTDVQTPDVEGYTPSKKQVSHEKLTPTFTKPVSKTVEITYSKVSKVRHFVQTVFNHLKNFWSQVKKVFRF